MPKSIANVSSWAWSQSCDLPHVNKSLKFFLPWKPGVFLMLSFLPRAALSWVISFNPRITAVSYNEKISSGPRLWRSGCASRRKLGKIQLSIRFHQGLGSGCAVSRRGKGRMHHHPHQEVHRWYRQIESPSGQSKLVNAGTIGMLAGRLAWWHK